MYRNLRRQGIMGVWAPELTRESIFEALLNRRVYATTNARILLRFSADGQPMGSEIRAGGSVSFRVYAASEVPIARVDLVRNGEDAQSIRPESGEVDWRPSEPIEESTCCYGRITRSDGQMAWSSPIWIDPV